MNPLRKIILQPALPGKMLRRIVRIVLFYAVFAALWILFSDRAAEILLHDSASLMIANTLKGLLFVAVTSLLLFFLLLRFAARQPAADSAADTISAGEPTSRHERRALLVGIVLLAVVFILVGISGIRHSRDSYRDAAGRQMQSIAQLKVSQLENWLDERLSDSRLAGSSMLFGELLSIWQDNGDPAVRERLIRRLEDFRTAYHYLAVLICDDNGNILLQAGSQHHDMGAVLEDAAHRAIASGKTVMTDLFPMHNPLPAHAHLDFVTPIRPVSGQHTTAVVLRANVEDSIYSSLSSWPVPSNSAETVLIRPEGKEILHLNQLRHHSDAAMKLRVPLSDKNLLSSKALDPGYLPGELIEGLDYRGIPVVGVALPVPGTSWWLLTKIDRAEVYSASHGDALWIVFASLLTWIVSATLAALLLQRRELQYAQQKRYEQAKQLNAMKLLSEIADASADAIFAKDLQGRYIMFNRAACGFTGKSPDQVIGQDDSILFPPEQAAVARDNDQQVMEENRHITFEEVISGPEGPLDLLTVKGPLHGDDGRIIGIYGISRDITERKTRLEELRRSNEELQRFNRSMIGRELEMIRLKREANKLAAALNQPPPYDLSVLEEPSLDQGTQEGGQA